MPTRTKQTPEAVRRILMDPESFTSTLTILLIDIYGTEYTEWEPTTILAELQDDYKATIPQIVFDRICCGIQLLTTDSFYKSCPSFITLCNVLAGYPVDGSLILPDSLSCAWGITEAMLLSPPEEDDEAPFTEEILAYLGEILSKEGIADPPGVLRLATMPESGEADFSDDPDMFAAVKSVDAAKKAEIEHLLRNATIALLNQISTLPLVNGNTAAIAKKLTSVAERF